MITLDIKSTNIILTPEIIPFLDKKIKMLSRRSDDIIRIDVNFRLENSSNNLNKLCEIRLVISGYDLLASSKCKTFEEAISKTTEALERQIEKRKTKNNNDVMCFSDINRQNSK
jgi:putative sigma-54 modulation protein